MISTITGEKSTQEHVTEFLSACEEVERRHFIFIKEEKIDEEESEEKENNNDNKDEEDDEEEENIDDNKGEDNLEEQKELLVARGPNENTRYDSKYLFEDLMCYSAKAPQHIQLIVKSLKQYFLNEANE
ncbi:hypothetical protein WN55_00713 [Dufourea novaeangliae]|uniref:Uncharacterized protein n=2 Tax=Dufourea novaeangliae TaxID=178035 RepID=A0A154P054_DUFNO|nr:hypothetical protein WN55_00713 [Dufourea novaeangliae]